MSFTEVLMILWRRSWIVALTFITAIVLALVIIKVVPARFDAEATASMDPNGVDPVTSIATSDAMNQTLVHGNMMTLVTSSRVAHDVVKRLNLTAGTQNQADYRASKSFGKESIEDWLSVTLAKNVEARFIFGTNVLSIKYKTTDPSIAAEVANTFLAATVDATVEMKTESAEQTAHWFAPELEQLRAQLAESRKALLDFQAENNLTNGSSDTQSSQLMSVTQELSNARASVATMESQLASSDPTLWADPADPNVQMLATFKNKLSQSKATTDAMSPFLSTNNPKAEVELANQNAILHQMSELKTAIEDHLKARIEAAKANIINLDEQRDKAQKVLIEAQAQRDHLADLQANVTFRQQQLDNRQKAAEQAELQSKMTLSNIEFLDRATPPISPSFPKPSIVLAVGLTGGLTLGLILALIAEALDRRVRAPGDLEIATPAPLLGAVGRKMRSPLALIRNAIGFGVDQGVNNQRRKSAGPQLLLRDNPTSPNAEAYRAIRAMLTENALKDGRATLVIAGPQPAHYIGSTLAAELALAFAETHVRTLLVDANLRAPQVATLFNLSRHAPGFVDIVTKGCPEDQAIVEATPYLDVLPAGLAIANPHEALALDSFPALVERLAAAYPIVIFDTSDALTAADAYVAAARSKGSVILRARRHKTSFHNLRQIAKTLDQLHCPMIGAVLERS